MELMDSIDGTFGAQGPNGTWGGVIGMIIDGISDFSIADLTIYKERMDVVDFVDGITPSINRLFMKIPNDSFRWTTFSDVFDQDFWISVLFATIGASIAFHVLFKFVRKETDLDILTSLGMVLCAFTAIGMPTSPQKSPGRILVLTILLTGTVLYWSFNAGLVSQLSVQVTSYPIKSLDDLVTNTDYKLIIEGGSAYVDYFQQATPESNRVSFELWQKHFKGTDKYFIGNLKDVEGMLINDDKLVYFAPELQTVLQMPRYPCQIISVPGTSYFKVALSWPFRKNSAYLPLFNHLMGQLKESGIDQKMIHEVVRGKLTLGCGEIREGGFKTIRYENIFSAFALLFAGAFGAFTALIAENVSKYLARKACRAGSFPDKEHWSFRRDKGLQSRQ